MVLFWICMVVGTLLMIVSVAQIVRSFVSKNIIYRSKDSICSFLFYAFILAIGIIFMLVGLIYKIELIIAE